MISWLQLPSTVVLEPKKIKFVSVSIVSPSVCHEVMVIIKIKYKRESPQSIEKSYCSSTVKQFPKVTFLKVIDNQIRSDQSLSQIQFFATPWTVAHQASLSFYLPELLKCMSIESVTPSNHLILCRPLLLPIFPSIRVFTNALFFFTQGGQSIGASVSASVLPMNIQD